jgi:hypothetical protein
MADPRDYEPSSNYEPWSGKFNPKTKRPWLEDSTGLCPQCGLLNALEVYDCTWCKERWASCAACAADHRHSCRHPPGNVVITFQRGRAVQPEEPSSRPHWRDRYGQCDVCGQQSYLCKTRWGDDHCDKCFDNYVASLPPDDH